MRYLLSNQKEEFHLEEGFGSCVDVVHQLDTDGGRILMVVLSPFSVQEGRTSQRLSCRVRIFLFLQTILNLDCLTVLRYYTFIQR